MQIVKRGINLCFSTKLYKNSQINLCSRGFASFFSTINQTQIQSSSSSSLNVLRNRIRSITDPEASVVPVLEQWINEGNSIYKRQLQSLITLMKDYRRFNHALEVSYWMTDRRFFYLSPTDAACRVTLIGMVYGSSQAEKYFKDLSGRLKTFQVYGALLYSYVHGNSIENAEKIMQEMREKGMVKSTFPYNMLLNLYHKTGHYEKIESVIHEMEGNGIRSDTYTILNLMVAYAASSNMSGIESILNLIEMNPDITSGSTWKVYSTAASFYLKAGLIETGVTMLRKMEEIMPRNRTEAFNFLLTHYGEVGKKDELYRVWNDYKSLYQLTPLTFCSMISTLSKLDDIEGVEKIFKEWETQCAEFDFRVLNRLLSAYSKKGLMEKAEAAMEKAMQGRKPYASTWDKLAVGYARQNRMSKAVEMLKRAISVSRKSWKPNPEMLTACLDYLEEQGNVEEMEEIVKSLKNLELLNTRDMYHRLKRSYIAAGKSNFDALDRMKGDDFPEDGASAKITEAKSSL